MKQNETLVRVMHHWRRLSKHWNVQ